MLQQIVDSALALYGANRMNLSFEDCMHCLLFIEDDYEALEYSEESEQESIQSMQYAVSFDKVIRRLSIHLTTFDYN